MTLLQNRNRLTDIENKLTVTKEEREETSKQIRSLGLTDTQIHTKYTTRTYSIAQGTIFSIS